MFLLRRRKVLFGCWTRQRRCESGTVGGADLICDKEGVSVAIACCTNINKTTQQSKRGVEYRENRGVYESKLNVISRTSRGRQGHLSCGTVRHRAGSMDSLAFFGGVPITLASQLRWPAWMQGSQHTLPVALVCCLQSQAEEDSCRRACVLKHSKTALFSLPQIRRCSWPAASFGGIQASRVSFRWLACDSVGP